MCLISSNCSSESEFIFLASNPAVSLLKGVSAVIVKADLDLSAAIRSFSAAARAK
ncbi:hypothetical protein BMEI1684 [Brucella melitensis bv. 1 str. 16M]|uniref:Uncharacterized protein n=2 Tax=Brucella TaxID=234 RepID=Q2YPA4_BRUA2|nr:hypothetical protein BMEI1684 [Brucella melitensis bv. 1 str. 16M]CAJ10225.1 conserved hypothetical protein [Brucella abortus 2308]SHO30087.1 predicted protein [Brucella abortus]